MRPPEHREPPPSRSTIDGPVFSLRVVRHEMHGWSVRGVTTHGQVFVIPVSRLPLDHLGDWLMVDVAMNGPPKRLADRLRRRLWLLRAATLGAPPEDTEPTVQPGARAAWARPILFGVRFEHAAAQGWCLWLSTSTGPQSYPVRSIPAGTLRRWIVKERAIHGPQPLAGWLRRWAWVLRNWALRA